MENSRKSKWLAFWFFLPCSLAMAYFVFYLASYAPDFATVVQTADAAPQQNELPVDANVVLSKGRSRTVGKIKLTYLGVKNDHIALDVTLLDLDPGYAYRRNIDIHAAKEGFWLAEKYFKLVSAGRSLLQIVRIQS